MIKNVLYRFAVAVNTSAYSFFTPPFINWLTELLLVFLIFLFPYLFSCSKPLSHREIIVSALTELSMFVYIWMAGEELFRFYPLYLDLKNLFDLVQIFCKHYRSQTKLQHSQADWKYKMPQGSFLWLSAKGGRCASFQLEVHLSLSCRFW